MLWLVIQDWDRTSTRMLLCLFFFQAEDGIRDLVRSRGLGDVYKRQAAMSAGHPRAARACMANSPPAKWPPSKIAPWSCWRKRCRTCLLYTSDAADERSSVDLGGRRIIKKKKTHKLRPLYSALKLLVITYNYCLCSYQFYFEIRLINIMTI